MESTFEAAEKFRIYIAGPGQRFFNPPPMPTPETVYEVTAGGRTYRVKGSSLAKWVAKRGNKPLSKPLVRELGNWETIQ